MSPAFNDAIAVTGCGWITPKVAGNISTVLTALAQIPSSSPDKGRFVPIATTELEPFGTGRPEIRKEAAVWLAAAALERALSDANVDRSQLPAERIGLVLGCALAGQTGMIDFANDVRQQSARFVSPLRFPQTVGNYISGALSRGYDLRGPASTIACGEASSLEALIEGCATLESGAADLVVAGGTERLSPQIVEGFGDSSSTYADGACLFVLERASDAVRRRATAQAITRPSSLHRGASSDALVSTAGTGQPGEVSIAAWIGRTLGADGAAALAAAIGACSGLPVPRAGPSMADSRVNSLGGRPTSGLECLEGHVVIRASDDRGQWRELMATIPPPI